MSQPTTLQEFRSVWLPHTTNAGLARLVQLLKSGSPLLIHGAFSRALPMGCLATHIGWHHPETANLSEDAGVCWLTNVAGLNPATSAVILEWDRKGISDWQLRSDLLAACLDEQESRERDSREYADAPVPFAVCGV